MEEREDKRNFGVFKPVGHVVVSFSTAAQADDAAQALQSAGIGDDRVLRYTDREMVEAVDRDLERASPFAALGQEINLVRAHRELAEKGYHWLVVHAPNDAQAAQVAEIARGCGAERAQSYGNFIVEELIDRPGNLSQVGESPDRGLDAQTPSGQETEAGEIDQDAPSSGARRGSA